MLDARLVNEFDSAVKAEDAPRPARLLNYVWINKTCLKSAGEPQEHLCGIPLNYLDKAYENARRYPDTPVNIWMDFDLMDASTRYFFETHAYLKAPENVKMQDLRTIPAYMEHPVYQQPHFGASIWQKVDLARFLVLDHCAKQSPGKTIFYADFDVEDVALDKKETHEKMDENGIVFGKLPKSEMITHYFKNNLSPGYIGINEKGAAYLSEKLAPELIGAAGRRMLVVMQLFRTLGNDFAEKDRSIGHTLDTLLTPIEMHPVGRIMPENPNYAAHGLCPPFSR